MADVFISYCQQDRPAAERVFRRLAEAELSAWWDHSLVAGETWNETVRNELRQARAVLVLWSRASWASRWVQSEASMGYDREILVAARLDDVVLEPPFNIIQTPDLRSPDGMDRLVEGVRRMARFGPLRHAAVGHHTHAPANADAPRLRIAILPFENLSPDPSNAFFADGLHEQILSTLANCGGGIEVISRTTMATYKGKILRVDQIAADLGCSYVLEGSVRREGDEVRLTVQLIDALTDQHLWAQDYDRTLTKALSLQSEVAKEVAGKLSITLGGKGSYSPVSARNPAAYDSYLKARLARQNLGGNGAPIQAWRPIKKYLDRAIELDPKFILAHVERAIGHWYLFTSNFDTGQATLDLFRADLKALLALAPDNPAVVAVRGLSEFLDLDYARAAKTLASAEAMGLADPDLLQWMAVVLVRMGRVDEGCAIYDRLLALDPGNLFLLMVFFTSECAARRPKDAARIADVALARAPGNLVWGAMKSNLKATFTGDVAERSEFVENIQKNLGGMEIDPEGFIGIYLEHLMFGGRYEEARAIIDRAPIQAYIIIWYTSLPVIGLGRFPTAAVRGHLNLLLNDRDAAAADGKRVLEFVAHREVTKWSAWFLKALQAQGSMLSGEKKSAVAAAHEAVELAVRAPDAFHWVAAKHMAARVLAWSDEPEAAYDLLAEISRSVPGIAPIYITRDPVFTIPLAASPRYQALSKRLEAEMAATTLA